jgi:hypothetical protein
MHVRCAAFSLSTAERLLNEQMFIHKGGRLKRSVPSWRIFNEKSPFKFKKLLAGEETTRKKRNNTLTLSPLSAGGKSGRRRKLSPQIRQQTVRFTRSIKSQLKKLKSEHFPGN